MEKSPAFLNQWQFYQLQIGYKMFLTASNIKIIIINQLITNKKKEKYRNRNRRINDLCKVSILNL